MMTVNIPAMIFLEWKWCKCSEAVAHPWRPAWLNASADQVQLHQTNECHQLSTFVANHGFESISKAAILSTSQSLVSANNQAWFHLQPNLARASHHAVAMCRTFLSPLVSNKNITSCTTDAQYAGTRTFTPPIM